MFEKGFAAAARYPVNLEGLRLRLLASRAIARDEQGWLSHPDMPVCDEGTQIDKFLEAFGIETAFVSMECDAPEFHQRWCDEGLTDCSEWAPTSPAGNGWMLMDIYDTEDGPYALFGRDQYAAEQEAKKQRTRDLRVQMDRIRAERAARALPLDEQEKAHRDLLLYGESFTVDGKHVPVECVQILRTNVIGAAVPERAQDVARAPEGWKLAPIEPIEVMLNAICESYWGDGWDDEDLGTARRVDARNMWRSGLAAAPAAPAAAPAQFDTDLLCVDSFAEAMKQKMLDARRKGRHGWQDTDPADLSRMLREHVEKGDPRDVANFCMMLWHHSSPIAATAPTTSEVADSEFFHPATQVYFRAGLIACREYVARFVAHESSTIAASIRANWWPSLGQDFGPPRKLEWNELTEGEYGEEGFRSKTAEEISPTQEALPIALQFLQTLDPTYRRATLGIDGLERSLSKGVAEIERIDRANAEGEPS